MPAVRCNTIDISTHALTWSATLLYEIEQQQRKISTHALTWSATWVDRYIRAMLTDFNSRTHVECDGFEFVQCTIKKFQLTHSRGVRHRIDYNGTAFVHFNSRTHVECDTNIAEPGDTPRDFNSRTHVECDTRFFRVYISIPDFNSRTHVECDYMCAIILS